jgi:ATP-dependent DNA ligase
MGLEGIVSKRKDSRYISGRSQDWLKSKNPESAAVRRERRKIGEIRDGAETNYMHLARPDI